MPYNRGMFLTHYTDANYTDANESNLDRIQKTRILRCAFWLMTPAEAEEIVCVPRWVNTLLPSCGVLLRDQKPLCVRKIPATPEEVRQLNEYVFFWGDSRKADFRRKQFQRKYKRLGCFLSRLGCSLDDLRSANSGKDILYACENTGGEKGGGRYCPLRSPAEETRAVEVVVRGEVRLPDNTQIECEDGNWRDFFCGDAA